MPRYKLTIEYDGTPFVGWQWQDNGPSVQGKITDAIARFCGEDVTVYGAGRTDARVHAKGQVAHTDLSKAWPTMTVRNALNYYLKLDPIVVLSVEEVSAEFDARFSATARHYLYRIVDRAAPLALERDRAWHVAIRLDAEAMAAAGRRLEGRHDFTTFRSVQCQAKSPVKTLKRLFVRRSRDKVLVEATARSFMHNQVRSMVGSLKLVGEGKWAASDITAALEAHDRAACGTVAPACGLYLIGVDY